MKIHNVLCAAEWFEPVIKKRKRFEIRENDRDYREGDFMILNEIDIEQQKTGRVALARIDYDMDDFEGLKEGWSALSITVFAAGKYSPDGKGIISILLDTIDRLRKQSFEGWTDDQINAYNTALQTIETEIRKNGNDFTK